jgi:hypothetical protein
LALTTTRQIGSHPKLLRRHQHAYYYFVERLLISTWIHRQQSPSCLNLTGRSVFCQAVASGHYWNLDDAFIGEKDQGPVQALFRECPDAILRRDSEILDYIPIHATTCSRYSCCCSPERRKREDQRKMMTTMTAFSWIRSTICYVPRLNGCL